MRLANRVHRSGLTARHFTHGARQRSGAPVGFRHGFDSQCSTCLPKRTCWKSAEVTLVGLLRGVYFPEAANNDRPRLKSELLYGIANSHFGISANRHCPGTDLTHFGFSSSISRCNPQNNYGKNVNLGITGWPMIRNKAVGVAAERRSADEHSQGLSQVLAQKHHSRLNPRGRDSEETLQGKRRRPYDIVGDAEKSGCALTRRNRCRRTGGSRNSNLLPGISADAGRGPSHPLGRAVRADFGR